MLLLLQTAREGVVLLTNPRGVLPYAPGALLAPGALAVVGPNAEMVAYGNYAGNNAVNVTPLQGPSRTFVFSAC